MGKPYKLDLQIALKDEEKRFDILLDKNYEMYQQIIKLKEKIKNLKAKTKLLGGRA